MIITVPPSMDPTKIVTVMPSIHPTIPPTKQTTKKKLKPTTVPSKKKLKPTIVPSKKKKKHNSKDFQANDLIPDSIDCHWTRDVVQETLENVTVEEATDDEIVKIETISQRVVYRRSCHTTNKPKSNILN